MIITRGRPVWYRTLAIMAGAAIIALVPAGPAAAATVSDEQWSNAGNINGVNCNYTQATLGDGPGTNIALSISIVNRSHNYDQIDTPPFRGCEVTPGSTYHTSHRITWALYRWDPSAGRWTGCNRADDLLAHNTWQHSIGRVYTDLPCGSGHYFLRVQAEHLMVTPTWSEWVGGQVQTSAIHIS